MKALFEFSGFVSERTSGSSLRVEETAATAGPRLDTACAGYGEAWRFTVCYRDEVAAMAGDRPQGLGVGVAIAVFDANTGYASGPTVDED